MIYTRYGIRFHLMKEHDIEMVRQWRNDPVVANNHAYREHITPEMQRNWFSSVNNLQNLYAIIEYQGEKVGVINLKNIDWEKRTCEGGIFIPDTRFHKTYLPAIVSYVTTEIIFVMFDWNRSIAHVLKDRKSNQEFVRQLGYELVPGQEEVENQMWVMTRESFEKRAKKLRKAISVVAVDTGPATLLFEPDELNNPLLKAWEDIVRESSYVITVASGPGGRVYTFGQAG